MDATELFQTSPVIPVVVVEDTEHAIPLADTLLAAGIAVVEVTLRTTAALQVVKLISEARPDMLVGVGSILHVEQVAAAREAGATFGVSPGATTRLLDAVDAANFAFVPGAATPSEMIALRERGYTLQKFFPAEQSGGIGLLRAVGGPLPDLRFVPTGGVTSELAAQYLQLSNVPSVGGSWIAPPKLLAENNFDAIGFLARSAAELTSSN